VPVGRVVSERTQPYQDGDVLVVPIYEEQVVVTKRLLLREELRVRRVVTTQRQLVQDTLKKERAEVEDPSGTGLVHEQYPTEDADERRHEGSLVDRVRRALQ
jgi:stress response protein YsnF